LTDKNKGWRRIAIILGILGGIIGGIIGDSGTSRYGYGVGDFFLVFLSILLGIASGLAVIVIGRWIASGFGDCEKADK